MLSAQGHQCHCGDRQWLRHDCCCTCVVFAVTYLVVSHTCTHRIFKSGLSIEDHFRTGTPSCMLMPALHCIVSRFPANSIANSTAEQSEASINEYASDTCVVPCKLTQCCQTAVPEWRHLALWCWRQGCWVLSWRVNQGAVLTASQQMWRYCLFVCSVMCCACACAVMHRAVMHCTAGDDKDGRECEGA